ncbi:MAG: hypothetical protein HZB16_10170 [Armatimonadetes bacterium]|nr:hypothetical protein [Armatimonadota bacterium]
MLDHCPDCDEPLRRLTAAQTAFYRLPFATAEWRLLGHELEGRRCEACTTLYLLPAGRPRAEACPQCEQPALAFERAELLPPSLIVPGREVIRLGCRCGYREVLEAERPVPRLPAPQGCLRAEHTRGVGFGLDY